LKLRRSTEKNHLLTHPAFVDVVVAAVAHNTAVAAENYNDDCNDGTVSLDNAVIASSSPTNEEQSHEYMNKTILPPNIPRYVSDLIHLENLYMLVLLGVSLLMMMLILVMTMTLFLVDVVVVVVV
jgi:hypothetical protein